MLKSLQFNELLIIVYYYIPVGLIYSAHNQPSYSMKLRSQNTFHLNIETSYPVSNT